MPALMKTTLHTVLLSATLVAFAACNPSATGKKAAGSRTSDPKTVVATFNDQLRRGSAGQVITKTPGQ